MNQNYIYLSAFLSEFGNTPDPFADCVETVSDLVSPTIEMDDTPTYEVSTLYANDLSFDTPLYFLENTRHENGISIVLLFTTNLERAAMFGAMVDSLKKSRGCEKSLYVIPVSTRGLPPQAIVELFSDFYYQVPAISAEQTAALMPLFLQTIADILNNKPIPDFTEPAPIDRLSPAELYSYFLQVGYSFNVIMQESDSDEKNEMLEILIERFKELGSIEAEDLHTDDEGMELFDAFFGEILTRTLLFGLPDQPDEGEENNDDFDVGFNDLLNSILQDLENDEDDEEGSVKSRIDPSELFDDWDSDLSDDEDEEASVKSRIDPSELFDDWSSSSNETRGISHARLDPSELFDDWNSDSSDDGTVSSARTNLDDDFLTEEQDKPQKDERSAISYSKGASMTSSSAAQQEFERRCQMMAEESALKRESTPRPDVRQVQFSAVYSETMRRGEYSILQIVMFEEAFQHAVEEAMAEIDGKAKKTTSGIFDVETKTKVKVVLSSPEAEISDNVAEAIWYGKHQNFEFDVYIPEDLSRRQVLFTAQIYFNGALATRLKFFAKCEGEPEPIRVERHDILSAFVSYASPDRNAVSCIVQGLKKARPDLQIFFDVESLRSGEDWETQLRHRIFDCDILFLCWSHHAKESKWVEYEWRYALENKGIECIEPIPLEDPSVCVPPTELQSKHFNDLMVYIRK
ncbi:MAG: toll/interleukin-1 receptor domain-containing protein [Ruminococcaceae bacterium]|nr:toll/interleukin-1 receptor domain-containing protein [Oscillospiraceae bacterium]